MRPSANQAAWELSSAGRRSDQPVEGGVHLPLLAPMLAGLKLRNNQRGLEFVLPNPSGGRGVYVASWIVVTGFASPSLHDTLLVGRLSGLDEIGPADVRDAARSIAKDGHAGEAAAEAAADVEASLRTTALRLGAQLLMRLARRGGYLRPEDAARCLSRDGFYSLAGRLGWHAPLLAEALRGLSAHYASVAIGNASGAVRSGSQEGSRLEFGRWGRLATLVQRLRSSLAEEQCNGNGADGATIGRIIVAADHCLRQADRLLPEIETMLADPLPLLETWREMKTESVSGSGQRFVAGWLNELEIAFDGWDRVCMLWFDAETPRLRQSVIPEMALLTRTAGNGDGWSTSDDADTGSVSERSRKLLARNERIRARELLLDLGAA